jgi:hypothetical protein
VSRGWWRAIALLTVILSLLAPVAVRGQSAAIAVDEATIERTVHEITDLRRAGNGHELYDWLTTESRARIPRQAFVAWLNDDQTFQPNRDPDIARIEVENYTWPVTGTQLPNVAVVTVHQRGDVDGVNILQEFTYPLQFDGARWRWVFGGNEASLLDVAAMGPEPIDYVSPYDAAPYTGIDRFWARIFEETGRDYQTMADVVPVVEQPMNTACGVVTEIDTLGIYVCLVNSTIYYSPTLKEYIDAHHGPMGWHTIVAHEWTHLVQAQIGIAYAADPELGDGAYILELELQADCMTGIYMQAERGAGAITAGDYRAASNVLATYGDRSQPRWDNPAAHGSGEQRVASFDNGATNGFIGCGLDLDTWDE